MASNKRRKTRPQSTTVIPSTPFKFMSLPIEIRQQILAYCFDSTTTTITIGKAPGRPPPRWSPPPATSPDVVFSLLSVSRQVRLETLAIIPCSQLTLHIHATICPHTRALGRTNLPRHMRLLGGPNFSWTNRSSTTTCTLTSLQPALSVASYPLPRLQQVTIPTSFYTCFHHTLRPLLTALKTLTLTQRLGEQGFSGINRLSPRINPLTSAIPFRPWLHWLHSEQPLFREADLFSPASGSDTALSVYVHFHVGPLIVSKVSARESGAQPHPQIGDGRWELTYIVTDPSAPEGFELLPSA